MNGQIEYRRLRLKQANEPFNAIQSKPLYVAKSTLTHL